jgi:hypothetical protein
MAAVISIAVAVGLISCISSSHAVSSWRLRRVPTVTSMHVECRKPDDDQPRVVGCSIVAPCNRAPIAREPLAVRALHTRQSLPGARRGFAAASRDA